MSLINDMLKDLDARQISPLHAQIEPLSNTVKHRPVYSQPQRSTFRQWIWGFLGGIVLIGLAFGMWQMGIWIAKNDQIFKKTTPDTLPVVRSASSSSPSISTLKQEPLDTHPSSTASTQQDVHEEKLSRSVVTQSTDIPSTTGTAKPNPLRPTKNTSHQETPVVAPLSALPVIDPGPPITPRPAVIPQWQKHQPITQREH
jgi:cytoskeletal protein RodZ